MTILASPWGLDPWARGHEFHFFGRRLHRHQTFNDRKRCSLYDHIYPALICNLTLWPRDNEFHNFDARFHEHHNLVFYFSLYMCGTIKKNIEDFGFFMPALPMRTPGKDDEANQNVVGLVVYKKLDMLHFSLTTQDDRRRQITNKWHNTFYIDKQTHQFMLLRHAETYPFKVIMKRLHIHFNLGVNISTPGETWKRHSHDFGQNLFYFIDYLHMA